jgi:hypothetical protein
MPLGLIVHGEELQAIPLRPAQTPPRGGRLSHTALCVTYPSANKALQESREFVGARR